MFWFRDIKTTIIHVYPTKNHDVYMLTRHLDTT